jgi:hypothetical protein
MRAWIIPTVAPILSAVLAVAGIVVLGQQAEQSLRESEQFSIAFADLACEPPGPLTHEAFLREVQYEADLPDRLDRLDDQLTPRLRAAFARHPWVKAVEGIEVRSDGIAVKLAFREPVLAVRGSERTHAVSADGVLLPRAALSADLPLLTEPLSLPAGRTGQSWGAAPVESAAGIATLLRYHRRQVPVVSLEFAGKDLVLWTANGSRIVWGQPQENSQEPSANLKCGRLVSLLEGGITLPVEIDLRQASGATRRTLLAAAEGAGEK